ncbi:hypothetical protein ACROYT_G011530 [Oculina patagonica]
MNAGKNRVAQTSVSEKNSLLRIPKRLIPSVFSRTPERHPLPCRSASFRIDPTACSTSQSEISTCIVSDHPYCSLGFSIGNINVPYIKGHVSVRASEADKIRQEQAISRKKSRTRRVHFPTFLQRRFSK